MSERLILKGALQEKKLERMRLATRAEGIIRGIKAIIQPASVMPLKDLKTGEALSMMEELDELRTSYLKVTRDVEEIERELA